MPGELAPPGPAVYRVPAALELPQGGVGKAPLDIQQVARITDVEAPREPARHLQRPLDIEPEIHQPDVALQVDLRLAVRAHAAEQLPQAAVLESHRRDQRVH